MSGTAMTTFEYVLLALRPSPSRGIIGHTGVGTSDLVLMPVHRAAASRWSVMIVPDTLEMLVTGDPVAEIDAALARGVTRLRAARAQSDAHSAERLLAWINYLLDQRLDFQYPVGTRAADAPAPG